MNAFKTYYWDVLKSNYFNFEGRATRKQFWMFFLFNAIIILILKALAFISTRFFGLLDPLYNLAILLPFLSISARRLHDTNRSGWWQLLNFLPFIGTLILLILLVMPAQPAPNRFDK